MQRFLIGSVKNYEPLFNSYEDEFFTTLKDRVYNFYKDNNIDYRKTNNAFLHILLTSLLLIACWLCMYLLPPWGVVDAAIS